VDLTVAAIPGYFASMGVEAWFLDRRHRREGSSPGDYERRDTVASLTMGVASLLTPLLAKPVFHQFDVGRGRYRKAVLGVAGAAAVTTVVADALVRAQDLRAGELPAPVPSTAGHGDAAPDRTPGSGPAAEPDPEAGGPRRARGILRRIAGSAAVTTIAATGAAVAGTWAARTTAKRLHERRLLPDLGTGPVAVAAAILGWDFVYYWNHRFMHESRYMWAIHVVHHSSERYNLSTALRQPVADSLGTFVPYGVLALLGIRPELIETARGVNLIYQFWIHTEAVPALGPLEGVLNTASNHRVHHGSNRQYLDRNHGSILIVWDRLFGTYEPEGDRVVYGLTKNIHSFDPLRIASHEYVDMARDVAGADGWHDRLSFVLRGPGWAYDRHRRLGTVAEHATEEAVAG
jgi:sterol desaturase/sphingolipid hydroxylase (fatty acid hydroxylase superfamily)